MYASNKLNFCRLTLFELSQMYKLQRFWTLIFWIVLTKYKKTGLILWICIRLINLGLWFYTVIIFFITIELYYLQTSLRIKTNLSFYCFRFVLVGIYNTNTITMINFVIFHFRFTECLIADVTPILLKLLFVLSIFENIFLHNLI